jgi:hypothetical protein
VQVGDVFKVKEAIERRREWTPIIIPQMEPLIGFLLAKSQRGSQEKPFARLGNACG